MRFQTIDFTIEQSVATLCLNRPEALNSFTATMHAEVREALQRLREAVGDGRSTPAIRCLLLTGRGRGFCAGQDLKDPAVAPAADGTMPDIADTIEQNYNPLIRALMELPVPVICAVNGVAAGAGVSIALACDLVLAARSASFIQAFCHIGLLPDSGGTWNLPRAVGMARAKGLAMLGEKLSAEQAEQWGLIWRCVDDDALMTEAERLARHLASQPTLALARIKQALNQSMHNDLHSQLALERDYMSELSRSHDYREGVEAFTAKRKPVFKGC
ncbi:MAG: 2-(1,2-epoxy-1,2-dihydrophenyl)acetyl-CoA isomerase [Gammaproteobacteria bacterium]|nr:2-(1,2-epoxy-1,2-dihydrophenyl)acetyl-CoA isomerase [Gammaproteobacteria bacterium]